MRWKVGDTIAAVATPQGIGGVGIVRVSGTAAPSLVDGFFRPTGRQPLADAASHQLLHGWFEVQGRTVDEVLVVRMNAPRSYTREDVVEVQSHGGPVVLRTILAALCGAGARAAEAGEFTFRAFLNGRLDLTQVEAVGDLVCAGSRRGLELSANQLRGRLHDALAAVRQDVRQVAALVAAVIDFPEEDEVFTQREDCRERIAQARKGLGALLATAEQGRVLREGLAVAICGRPNVGKSSLLNALLRESRAIVTEFPGTTRDTIEELAEIQGLAVSFTDTAGIRQTADPVEQAGIARSRKAAAQAGLTLLVLDGTQTLCSEDRELLAVLPPAQTLAVINKRDCMMHAQPEWHGELGARPWMTLSALTGDGLPALEQAIVDWALGGDSPPQESALLANLRQQDAAQRADAALKAAAETLCAGQGEELLAVDLTRALDALGEILGETTTEDLLDAIFAEFCIGK